MLGIVLMVVYQGVDSVTQAIGGTERRLANLDEARILMAVTTKDIRTATRLQAGTSPFALADKREVIFYANLNNDGTSGSVVNNGPRQVRIYVDSNSELIEEVKKPDAVLRAARVHLQRRGDAAVRRPVRRQRGELTDLPVLRRERHRAHRRAALRRATGSRRARCGSRSRSAAPPGSRLPTPRWSTPCASRTSTTSSCWTDEDGPMINDRSAAAHRSAQCRRAGHGPDHRAARADGDCSRCRRRRWPTASGRRRCPAGTRTGTPRCPRRRPASTTSCSG